MFCLLFEYQNVYGRAGAVSKDKLEGDCVKVAGCDSPIEFLERDTFDLHVYADLRQIALNDQCHAFPQCETFRNEARERESWRGWLLHSPRGRRGEYLLNPEERLTWADHTNSQLPIGRMPSATAIRGHSPQLTIAVERILNQVTSIDSVVQRPADLALIKRFFFRIKNHGEIVVSQKRKNSNRRFGSINSRASGPTS